MADRAGFENRCALCGYRGFESRPLRFFILEVHHPYVLSYLVYFQGGHDYTCDRLLLLILFLENRVSISRLLACSCKKSLQFGFLSAFCIPL